MLVEVDREAVEAQLGLIEGARILTPDVDDGLHAIRSVTVADASEALLTRVRRQLAELDVEWAGPRQLSARGRTANPVQTAGRILDLADEDDRLAVLVSNDREQWALLVSTGDRLLMVDGRKAPVMYTTHRRDVAMTPLEAADKPGRLGSALASVRHHSPSRARPSSQCRRSSTFRHQLPLPATVRLALRL